MASRKEIDACNENLPMRNQLCAVRFNKQVALSFLLWLSVVVLGFAYVAMYLCQRAEPFRSGNNAFQDFTLCCLTCGLLFWLGPVCNFKWRSDKPIHAGLLFASFVIPFFAALHWAFVGKAIGAHFSLTPNGLSTLDLPSLIALVLALLCVAFVFAYHIIESIRNKCLTWYLLAFGVAISGIAAVTIAMAQTHYLHFHHYCVGLLLFPFCRFRSMFSVSCQAFFLGLAVEGVARWGFDPIWCLITR